MKASDRQEGGKHYKDFPIQPAEFCQRNQLNWCESNVVKYVARHRGKKGAEDIRKAIHYLELLLEWEYSQEGAAAAIADVKRDMGGATVKDATAESLCLTCGRDPGCVGDYPRTKDGGCEGYIKAERKASLCHSCYVKDCPANGLIAANATCDRYSAKEVRLCASCADKYCPTWTKNEYEKTGRCYRYKSALRENMLDAKQEAPTAAVSPLDFTLPSIALKCTAEEAMAKFESEIAEWRAAKKGSLHEIAERWDCLQALYTFAERGGDVAYYLDHVRTVMGDLAQYAAEGRDVMKAKRGVLFKNASRHNAEGGRGYYAPETCAAIIASKGHRVQPLDEMGVI